MNLAFLDPDEPQFPDPSAALAEPDGLLAFGGNLEPKTLVDAYRQGIFPWYQDEDESAQHISPVAPVTATAALPD